jgi:molybdate transport system ATP-binding protein
VLDAHVVRKRRTFTVDVRLSLVDGSKVALFGASGEGKSTVLSCIAGIEPPDDGEISFRGRKFFPPPMPLHERAVGYLTQQDLLFPHLSVEQNVRFGLNRDQQQFERDWIDELRARLNLGSVWRARARQISGGQARRVAMARMLARRPPLVLLDEPFTGLDYPTILELVDDLVAWHAALGFTLIAVDHRPEILKLLCPHAIAIEGGVIVQEGTWEELSAAPATPALARLLTAR